MSTAQKKRTQPKAEVAAVTNLFPGKRIGEVFVVKDANVLAKSLGNRPIHTTHVARLRRSMAEKSLLRDFPIKVSHAGEVIDGQHRLLAAIELGLPVYATLAADITAEDVRTINDEVMKWNLEDYLHYHIAHGNQNYARLQQFSAKAEELGMPFGVTSAMFLRRKSGVSDTDHSDRFLTPTRFETKLFREGEFEYPADDKWAHDFLAFIAELGQLYPGFYLRKSFVLAALCLFRHPEFDVVRLRSRLNRAASMVIPTSSSYDFLRMFEGLYNFDLDKKNRIKLIP